MTPAHRNATSAAPLRAVEGARPAATAFDSAPSLPEALLVRPRGRLISTVEVRAGVSHSSVAEGNCVRREAGVESNRRRTVGPQDDEPVSAVCRGEPARGR